MRLAGDFPAMSHTIRMVSEQTRPESEASVTELTSTILEDFALTHKLLKIVNTVYYIKFQLDGKISTISRAVYVLGFTQVRNCALSLMLIENLKNPALKTDFKDALIISFMSGIIAREAAKMLKTVDAEEAFICALFHDLGKILTTYYLTAESRKIKDLVMNEGAAEEDASRSVLGMSYEKLGMGISMLWHFSENIIYCMQKIPQRGGFRPVNPQDHLRCLAGFSHMVCSTIDRSDKQPDLLRKTLRSSLSALQNCFVLSEKQVTELIDRAFKEIIAFAGDFGVNMKESPFLKKVSYLLGSHALVDVTEEEGRKAASSDFEDLGGLKLLEVPPDGPEDAAEDNPEAILSKGIQEIAGFLLEDYSLNDVLRMILEVLYRAFKFTRVLICIRNTKASVMEGRFGFGPDVHNLIQDFAFPIDPGSDDVFNLALSKDSDILISDRNDPRIEDRIPSWYKKITDTETFILSPVTVTKKAIGLIYADKPSAFAIHITKQQLRFLKTIRNQAILAIKQRM